MFSFLNSLYFIDSNHLSDVYLVKIFSHSVGHLFSQLTVPFIIHKLFNLMGSHLSLGVLTEQSYAKIFSSSTFRSYTMVFGPFAVEFCAR